MMMDDDGLAPGPGVLFFPFSAIFQGCRYADRCLTSFSYFISNRQPQVDYCAVFGLVIYACHQIALAPLSFLLDCLCFDHFYCHKSPF